MNITKTAMITVCGRPNVGKSSLTNALVGEKIAIVSNKPQTTRNRIYGVVNRGDTQFVLLDTPGLHKARYPAGRLHGQGGAGERGGRGRACCCWWSLSPMWASRSRILLQRIQEEQLPARTGASTRSTRWRRRSPCWRSSRHTMRHTTTLTPSSPSPPGRATGWMSCWRSWQHTPSPGPQLFPDGMTTDQPEQPGMRRDRPGEAAAVPGQGDPPRHGGGGDEVFRAGGRSIIDLDVTIYCEKASHKGIIIGKGGAMLKRISSAGPAGH